MSGTTNAVFKIVLNQVMSLISNNLWCCLSMPVVISVSSAFVILGFKSDVITPCCEQLCAKVVIESLFYETARKRSMLNEGVLSFKM